MGITPVLETAIDGGSNPDQPPALRIYVLGGVNGEAQCLSSVECFSPQTGMLGSSVKFKGNHQNSE